VIRPLAELAGLSGLRPAAVPEAPRRGLAAPGAAEPLIRPPKGLLAYAALAASLALPARAAFEDLGAGARAPGMGGAFVAVADDVYAPAYNPAGLGTLDRTQLGASYARLFWGLSDGSNLGLSNVAFAQPLRAGRWGALGLSWNTFKLDELYSERAAALGWGRLAASGRWGRLYAGAQARSLRRGFTPPPEALNAKDGEAATGLPDPVLSGKDAVSAWGADAGLLLRAPGGVSAGLSVLNANEPDVGFGGSDPLARQVRLGLAYKALWMNLAGEVRSQRGPGGETDRDATLAAERFFQTLDYGQFGFRAAMSLGARDFKQASAGVSYRVNKIRFDYAFLLPLGSVRETAGTHRFGLAFMFGAPTPEEEVAASLVSEMQRLRRRSGAGLGYESLGSGPSSPLERPGPDPVRPLLEAGRFLEAHGLLVELLSRNPKDPALFQLARRLDIVVSVYPAVGPEAPRADRTAARAALAFLAGEDRPAVLIASYAQSLDPARPEPGRLLQRLVDQTGIKPETARRGRTLLEEKHQTAEAAFRAQNHAAAVEACRDALFLEPQDLTALKRLGTNQFLMGRRSAAAEAWRQALVVEKDPVERASMERFVKQAESAPSAIGSLLMEMVPLLAIETTS